MFATLLLLSLSNPASSGAPVRADPPPFELTGCDELESIERRLEDAPDDAGLLAEAAGASLASEDPDRALWYALLARAAGAREKTFDGLREDLGVDAELVVDPRARHAEVLLDLAKGLERKKLYANAVELLGRCLGTPAEEAALERLEKLYGKEKVVTALLESGVDVPVRSTSRRDPADVARLDAKHATWEDAHEVKGKHYTVKTNMSIEMAEAILDAMEQMNAFYRQVFGYKQRGGTMRRCVLRVYATRAEFDRYEAMSKKPGTKGFYASGENSVTTYDPRTEPRPRSIADLWSTLFHEASHQFTRTVWPNQIPTWLNEGTASYFEGARLLPNGTVAFNGIPDSRLRNLVASIERGSPTVRDVVSYFQPGSYEGSYYPFGWGLVYFCRNWEDESSRRPYLDAYVEFMETYKGGGKHDVFERFVEYFVERPEVDGVESFEDFVALWEDWIRDLHALHFGGAEQADRLLERAARQVANGALDAARESFEWALRKRPGDARARSGLAGVLAELELEDAALYHYRRLAESARRAADPAAPFCGEESARDCAERAAAAIVEIDRVTAEKLARSEAEAVGDALAAAEALAETGFRRAALWTLGAAEETLAGDARLAAAREELAADGLDIRRWRRLPTDDTAWERSEAFEAREGGIVARATALEFAFLRRDLPARFRYEVRVTPGAADGGFAAHGLIFGADPSGEELFSVLPGGALAILRLVDGESEALRDFDRRVDDDAESYRLAVEVDPDGAEFFVDGDSVGSLSGPGSQGRVGLFAQSRQVAFDELRLRY